MTAITINRATVEQALEVLKFCTPKPRSTDDDYAEQGWQEHNAAITALSTALAQQAEPVEPVATLTAQRDALLEALLRIESAVDWYLGRSSFTQTTQLKGLKHSANVRKELFAAHDEVRTAIKAVEGAK